MSKPLRVCDFNFATLPGLGVVQLATAAVPQLAGRFPRAERVRLPDSAYRTQRNRYLGPAAEIVLDASRRLERRSPRRIADVVNRVWDLYDYLHKQDRPSGTGYAEIDDDGPDQILYATVTRAEMPALLNSLSMHEGLALIAFDKGNIPNEFLRFVLSPAEAKGLDFHSVCVLNGGFLLQHIVNARASAMTDTLMRRLAIDQLRVALSRPTERLLWVDVAPEATTAAVREATYLMLAEIAF